MAFPLTVGGGGVDVLRAIQKGPWELFVGDDGISRFSLLSVGGVALLVLFRGIFSAPGRSAGGCPWSDVERFSDKEIISRAAVRLCGTGDLYGT